MMTEGCEVILQGFVQGQGIRPAIARLAAACGWTGTVRNASRGVIVTLCGSDIDVDLVVSQLRQVHAALAAITIAARKCRVELAAGFEIETSTAGQIPLVPVPRDVAICDRCLQEIHDAGNRRFHYGFISCAECGPRFSIAQELPFDRTRTTLSAFPLCSRCRQEYAAQDDRRYHAQTMGCPDCGPRFWVTDRQRRELSAGDAACQMAAQAILRGAIVAVKGIGGYQLLVDATSDAAVGELRRRKRRITKPLAVLCGHIAEAESLGQWDPCGREALTSPANPIVIVPRRWERGDLSPRIHPRLNDIGLLLPTTGIHARLCHLVGRPLVCTSGNREGEPLAVETDEAQSSLAEIADLWLHHDRPIHHPVDDSVVRIIAGRAVTIRLARGMAPSPLTIPAAPPMIALGGYQKATLAWSNGVQSVLGPHIGDLDDVTARHRLIRSLGAIRKLYRIEDCHWITDGHPDDVAQQFIPNGVQPHRIWHHHAHLAASMLEHDWLGQTVLGIAADGQGYGPDGRLWGGEVLRANATGFQRLATVQPFALPGGESAARNATRVAVSLLGQLPDWTPQRIAAALDMELRTVRLLLGAAHATITPWTSSLGRLFDGVARLVLGPHSGAHPGEPAAWFEAACDPAAQGCYRWLIHEEQRPGRVDWRPMLQELGHDLERNVAPGVIAERFHRSVATWMIEVQRLDPSLPMVVGGGVFQNRRLCELLAEMWPTTGFPLGLPGRIPPNDGGLAAGQLAVAAAQWNRDHNGRKP